MSDTTALTTPQDQVDQLINQVADEAGLEIQHGLGEVKVPAQAVEAGKEETKEEDGKLAERLRALRVSRPGWGYEDTRSRSASRVRCSRRCDGEIYGDIWRDSRHLERSPTSVDIREMSTISGDILNHGISQISLFAAAAPDRI